jgi:hypothetical protein
MPSVPITIKVMVFSLSTPVSSTNKTDHHDITEILLKVALNTTTLTLLFIEYFYTNAFGQGGLIRKEIAQKHVIEKICFFF